MGCAPRLASDTLVIKSIARIEQSALTLTQGNRFKRFSSPEAQSFRLQSRSKAAKAALNHEQSYQEQV
jgi:hypothetical protein